MCEANRKGQKSGIGHYRYVKNKHTGRMQSVPDPNGMAPFLAQSRKDAGNPPILHGVSDKDVVEVMMLPVVNECFRVIAEGHVIREADIDVVSCLGYAFPSHRYSLNHDCFVFVIIVVCFVDFANADVK